MGLSESNLIASIKNRFPDYIGDDAAVIDNMAGEPWVITKDLLVEGVHFNRTYVPPDSLACKALQSNLSDLAAMGAVPKWILLGLSAPAAQSGYVNAFVAAFTQMCEAEGVYIIGGDTTASQADLFISVSAIGSAVPEQLRYRHTAQAGDLLCLIGECGSAHVGRLLLEKGHKTYPTYEKAFLYPKAKVAVGHWLAQQSAVSSLMDCSDGLAIDVHKLCKAAKLGADMALQVLPSADDFNAVCALLDCDPTETLLTGGEDYSLLCTVKADQHIALAAQLQATFGESLYAIGTINQSTGVHYFDNGQLVDRQYTPFSHFNEIKGNSLAFIR